MPSYGICIRAIESERYKVIDQQKNIVLEEIEESKAFFQVYEGAVYMNQGRYYLVKKLDLSSKVAFCQEADLKYYTKTRDYTDIHVIGGDVAYAANATVELSLPKYSYESQAVWIQVPQSVKTAVEKANLAFRAGLHAASHAVLNIVPMNVSVSHKENSLHRHIDTVGVGTRNGDSHLAAPSRVLFLYPSYYKRPSRYIICNSSDLAPECFNPHDTRYFPERILLYDQHPGGTGLSMRAQPFFTEMLTAALQLVTSCCCSGDTGCPNCVQSLACHEYNGLLNKDAAIMIIKGVIESEKAAFGRVGDVADRD
ncbi:hypothetical protein Dimus_005078 [Dionaea muscipula]